MRYLIRAIKYFVYICVIVIIILAILVLMNLVSSDINVMFQHGWKSVGLIAVMFAGVSAFYPMFGYTKRLAAVLGELDATDKEVIEYMTGDVRKYNLESQDGEKMTFRSRSFLRRIIWDDRITIEKGLGGYYVEGVAREVAKIVPGLEFKFHNPDPQDD
ncbi:MAG: hypothetical protein Q4G10_03470 [Bacteroidia bacterium]|nr:hypothetical protein [Bacteroidia bacterium]